MRLLVMGGGRFVGHAVVTAALSRGWEVTIFNRGISSEDPPGARAVRGDRTCLEDLVRLGAAGPWDAVADTSGYVPRDVLAVCEQLEPAAGRYVFMSTVSVYRRWPTEPLTEASELLSCPPDAGPDFGEDTEDGPTRYGYQKAGCELAVTATFGSARTALLRPGVVLGPREYVGRLPWWLRRVADGGRVLAPGSPARAIQPVDVRDLAEFALAACAGNASGPYNVTAPVGSETFGGLLAACVQATGSDAVFTWVPDDVLLAQGVRQWSEMPTAAQARGLCCRPLAETAGDTWTWMQHGGGGRQAADSDRAADIGISREREQRILAAVG
jgi:2'-hydroxyisoflavone reductase